MTNDVTVYDSKPHFVLVPFMAQGHMMPAIDLAHLLAGHGALVSVITTPFNASRIRSTIDHARESGLPIRFVELQFPCAEVGLPEGCENIDVVPSPELALDFFKATDLLQQPLQQYLMDHPPYPSCIIADMCHPWTGLVARNLCVPRLTFFSICCFTLLGTYNVWKFKVFDNIVEETKQLEVPGLPQGLLVTKAQAPGFFTAPGWEKVDEDVRAAEFEADGIVVNTFDDLEQSYIRSYEKAMGKKVWSIGPFSLRNKDIRDMAARGNKASIDVKRCMDWLDSMKPSSVLYVSFGTITRVVPSQLIEIGSGLEGSGNPFIWVIKNIECSPEVEQWLSEGFEKRTSSRGLVLRGWAPQVAILSHPAIGGFMTHCGWNSTLEGISAGVPMITWPHFGDQFLNDRLVVDVIGTGISVGARVPTIWGDNNTGLFGKRDDVESAVRRLMDDGEEGEERRKRAREFGKKAREAMKEGGSSYQNLTNLIQCFPGCADERTKGEEIERKGDVESAQKIVINIA